MRAYAFLDASLLIFVFLDIAYFYSEISRGHISPIFLLILAIITIAYFIALNLLNERVKQSFRKFAEHHGCKFHDKGHLTLQYEIVCDDWELEGSLRSTYMPDSVHIKFKGKFKEAWMRGKDPLSQKFTEELLKIAIRYGARVNDAYTSHDKGEVLVTRIPTNEKKIFLLLQEIENLFRSLRE